MTRTLGILGGMSWASTEHYYRLVNQEVGRRRGRQHSANLILTSEDLEDDEDGTILKVRAAKSSSWSSLSLPDDGASGTISGICRAGGKETEIEVAFQNPETGEVRVGSAHVLVTGSGSSTVKVAFDDKVEGTPDDNVMTLRCGSGTLEVR